MIDTHSKQRAIEPGHRVHYQDYIGTVKYIGELEGHKSVWLGIDWDDPSRGKHNGAFNGKQYFETMHETSGSFIRPEKVNTGINIIESIISRYGYKDEGDEKQYYQHQFASLERKWNAPFLELVGFDNITDVQSNHNRLSVLSVRMDSVNHLGEPHQLSALCPHLTELDLSKNLINSWMGVFEAVKSLETLKMLNVSENRLEMPEDVSNYNIPQVTTLLCSSMKCLTWNDVNKLSKVFPNLEYVCVTNNKLTTIGQFHFPRLISLDMDDNMITEWSDVMKFSDIPSLQHLNLCANLISEINIDGSDKFRNLESLNIANCLIDNLSSLRELNKLESLTSLRISKNPIYNLDKDEMVNQVIIAMIGRLKRLRGTDITREVRKDAEIDYVKKYGLEWLAAKDNAVERDKFLSLHTRYLELIQKYGEMEAGELKVEAKTIKESLVELNIVYEDRIVKKKVPPTMQGQKLIILCQRLFRLPHAPTLIYIGQEQPHMEFDLDESREINIYSVESGDKIVVKC